MHRIALWRRAAHCAVFSLFLLLGSNPALADRAADLDARAAAEYNRGLDARDAGQNAAACEHFRNSAVLYENSISALTSRYMGSEEARDAVKSAANAQQSSANGAKARAREVCGRPDGPALTSSSGSSSSNGVDYNAEKKLALQRSYILAQNQNKEADRLWDAGDRPGACAMISRAAANYDTVTSAMKANKALEAALYPVTQVYENAANAVEVRDKIFCSKVTDAQRASLKQDSMLSQSKGDEAKRLYEADDQPGSCIAARLSTDAYDRMTSAMRSNPELRTAFEDPDTVIAHAKIMADHRDRFYCAKPG